MIDLIDYKVKTMNNGIKVVIIKKNTAMASVRVGFKVGSLCEENNERGISHLLEHMLFKGTEKRSGKNILSSLQSNGGEFNAFTDYDRTVYYIDSLVEDMESSVEMLSDMVMNSVLPEEALEKEKGVVCSEIAMYRDDKESIIYSIADKAAFPTHPMRYEIGGEEETVLGISRDRLVEYYKYFYVPSNCFVSIVSPYDHDAVFSVVEKYFGDWHGKEFVGTEFQGEDSRGVTKVVVDPDINQSHICRVYTFNNLNYRERVALEVANFRLGNGMNSLMGEIIREEMGLAYTVYSTICDFSFNKILYMYAGTDQSSIGIVNEAMDKCISIISENDNVFTDDILATVKKTLKIAISSGFEETSGVGGYALRKIMLDRSIDEFVEKMNIINSLTGQEIVDVVKKVFKNPTTVVLRNE